MRFVPDNWKPRPEDINWAMEKYKISCQEADRQLEEFRDHEFRRDYTDWNRCFRNWFRSADKYDLLFRERQPWKPEVVTEKMKKEDQQKWVEDMHRLGHGGSAKSAKS